MALGRALSRLGCNIEVALIDTEGQKAIDVFLSYRTREEARAAETGIAAGSSERNVIVIRRTEIRASKYQKKLTGR